VPRLGRRWLAAEVGDPRFLNNCDKIAKQIQKLIGGEVKKVLPTPGAKWLGAFKGMNLKWYWHEVVVLNGRVYDAFTGHLGLPIAEYKALWQDASGIIFGF
jgi:hypothetical protein